MASCEGSSGNSDRLETGYVKPESDGYHHRESVTIRLWILETHAFQVSVHQILEVAGKRR